MKKNQAPVVVAALTEIDAHGTRHIASCGRFGIKDTGLVEKTIFFGFGRRMSVAVNTMFVAASEIENSQCMRSFDT